MARVYVECRKQDYRSEKRTPKEATLAVEEQEAFNALTVDVGDAPAVIELDKWIWNARFDIYKVSSRSMALWRSKALSGDGLQVHLAAADEARTE